jgi:hypothetical protein
MYKLVKRDDRLVCINKVDGNDYLLIPINPDNTDYQAYLKYIAEGGVVLPADEGAA